MKKSINLKILGSISPYSTNFENCPGYLLSINNNKVLLDCGSGVCKKLNLPKDFENLSIFISHFHKDHYIDIFAIAYASYVYHNLGILKDRIKVYIPKTYKKDYEYYDYILLKNLKEQYFDIIEYDVNSIYNIGEIKVTFMENYHSIRTFTTKFEYDNKKIIYASDLGKKTHTDLADFAKYADILLIESSFLENDSIDHEFHLTAKDAALIAKDAMVKKLLLTHFWPSRNKKLYLSEAKKHFNRTYICMKDKTFKL